MQPRMVAAASPSVPASAASASQRSVVPSSTGAIVDELGAVVEQPVTKSQNKQRTTRRRVRMILLALVVPPAATCLSHLRPHRTTRGAEPTQRFRGVHLDIDLSGSSREYGLGHLR